MTNRIWSVEDDYAAAVTVDKNSITMLANGGYVVAWREGESKIALQVYNGLGQKIAPVQFMEGATTQRFAQVNAIGSDGDFVVTWSEIDAANSSALYTQRFTAAGAKIGVKTELPTSVGFENAVSVSPDAAGGWATVYSDAATTLDPAI